MNYFKNNNNEIYAYDNEQVQQGYGKDMEELLSPIFNGKVLIGHKNISQVELKPDGSYATYYNEDGTINTELELAHDTKNLLQSIESSIQGMLDDKAKEFGYDNIVAACSYAGYPNKYQEEAVKLGTWRSDVWDKAYELQSSMTEVPTVEEVLNQLPKYEEIV